MRKIDKIENNWQNKEIDKNMEIIENAQSAKMYKIKTQSKRDKIENAKCNKWQK